jgi:hypothetical protein
LKDNQLPDDENFQKFKELNAMMLTGNNGGVELNIATKVFISNRFTLQDDVKTKAKKFFRNRSTVAMLYGDTQVFPVLSIAP